MKVLYLDCGMGAAGDMLTAALLELLPEPDAFVERLNGLHVPGVEYVREQTQKCGILGTHVSVRVHGAEEAAGEDHIGHAHHGHDAQDDVHCVSCDAHDGVNHVHDAAQAVQDAHHAQDAHVAAHHAQDAAQGAHDAHHGHAAQDVQDAAHHDHPAHHHHHSTLQDVRQIVSGLDLPEKVKRDVMAVYGMIAEAEGHAHGVTVEEVHFHEVGAMDAVADVAAVCLLMDELAPGAVVASPVHVGSGQVRCAHGILPVPAPATAFLLKDVPIYGGAIQGELCTPTGAALLKYFVSGFGDVPVMKLKAVGYGMGKKDFERANCVRAMLGETEDGEDAVYELDCNVDDMTGEAMGFAMERLFAAGALEVYTQPVNMKKSRPGTLLCVMCREADRERMVREIFAHTTTIGIREKKCGRYVLDRTTSRLHTPWGDVRCKTSQGYGVRRCKCEYDDLAKIAAEQGMGLEEVRRKIFIGQIDG